jgi:GTP-binding nuclear protein Ran
MQDLTVNNEVRIPSYPFKVVLLGDGGTGKTTFVKRFIQEPSPRKWVPNISVDINVLRFDTAHGKIALNVWDTGTFASLLSLFLSLGFVLCRLPPDRTT